MQKFMKHVDVESRCLRDKVVLRGFNGLQKDDRTKRIAANIFTSSLQELHAYILYTCDYTYECMENGAIWTGRMNP